LGPSKRRENKGGRGTSLAKSNALVMSEEEFHHGGRVALGRLWSLSTLGEKSGELSERPTLYIWGGGLEKKACIAGEEKGKNLGSWEKRCPKTCRRPYGGKGGRKTRSFELLPVGGRQIFSLGEYMIMNKGRQIKHPKCIQKPCLGLREECTSE